MRARRGTFGVLPEAAAIFCLALATMLPGIFGSPLVRTEPHRAVPAHEMVVSGQWLMPQIYGVPYLRKPPLHYWALAATERLTGRTDDWIYRLPSVIATAMLAFGAALFAGAWFNGGDATGRSGRIAAASAGLATLALVPLWGQARTADVDALNTLFTALAAWLAMDVLRRRGVGAWWIVAALALAFGAASMTKGPAGWPVVAGAAVAAWWALRPMPWRAIGQLATAFVGGAGLLVLWGAASYLALRSATEEFDWTGLGEAASKLDLTDPGRFVQSVTLPFLIVAFCVPVVLAIPFVRALNATTDGQADDRPEHGPVLPRTHVDMARASAIAFVLALFVGAAVGLDNMRYLYPTVPILAPLVGAVAAAWAIGAFSSARVRQLRGILTGTAIGFGTATLGLAIASWINAPPGAGIPLVPLLLASIGVPATLLAVTLWLRRAVPAALGATVLIITVAGLAFGHWRAQSRAQLSSLAAATVVRDMVGIGNEVLSGEWVMADPSLFHYADVRVDYRPRGLRDWTDFNDGQWVVFEVGEWERLGERQRGRFVDLMVLPVRNADAVLGRFRADVGEDD